MNAPTAGIALATLGIPAAVLAVTHESLGWLAVQIVMQFSALALIAYHELWRS